MLNHYDPTSSQSFEEKMDQQRYAIAARHRGPLLQGALRTMDNLSREHGFNVARSSHEYKMALLDEGIARRNLTPEDYRDYSRP